MFRCNSRGIVSAILFSICLLFTTKTGWAASTSPSLTNNLFTLHSLPDSESSGSYQIAKSTFLPELKDSEWGFGSQQIDGNHNKNKCQGYVKASCPPKASCKFCPFDHSMVIISGCAANWTRNGNSCTPNNCAAIDSSYKDAIPDNNICTKSSEYNKTCFKNCRTVSCSAYSVSCTTKPEHATSVEKCPDCENSSNSKCIGDNLCKVTACEKNYKINSNATGCILKDDTYPNGYNKTCETGTQGDPKYTEIGTACWQCKPPEVQCEAPYYRNEENKCVLWDGVAALAKTCSDLITTTKNGNITGNILIWGTLNCNENEIKLSTGQNLVGRAFFNGKYPEATDSATNKFSKITWNFQSKKGNGLTLEHNSTLADLTLEVKSNVNGSWSSPYYIMPALIEAGTKENLIFKNVDLYGDMSAAESKGLTLINATTAKYTLKGNNSFRFKNNLKTNDSSSYAANTTYLLKNGTMNIGQDATLNIEYINGGASYSIIDAVVNLTDNAKMTVNDSSSLSSYSGDIFEEYSSWSDKAPKSKLTMSGTSRLTVIAPQRGIFSGQIELKDNSSMNIRGRNLFSGSAYMNGPFTLQMSGNSIFNGDISATGYGAKGTIILNNYATLRIRSAAIGAIDGGNIILNNNSKFIIKQNTTLAPSNYTGVIRTYRNSPSMNGNSKFYIEANRHVFKDAGFNLASTSAKLYVRQTDTAQKIFGVGYSNPEVWLYKTVSNAPFYIETPGQNGYNGVEDDGMYLMPALGVSASDGASICSHMTGGYSSSKINRDLACWTHERDANPNNNDYFKGRQCDRCSTGYRLTGVTQVSKYDSRFTSTKSDFDSEMSALTSAMNF